MNGMIFAAGLGTRLRPLTDNRPKALVKLKGRPLLQHVIEKMKIAGIRRIVINVHHYADLIEDFLKENRNFGMDILISNERECLLDTGGGLLKAKELFLPGEPVLIHNVDILSAIDLTDVINEYHNTKAYATLVVRPHERGRVLKFDANGVLKGWENTDTVEQKIVDEAFYTAASFGFCGVHVVSPELLQNMMYNGVFSIIDEYLAQARQHALRSYVYKGIFLDLGTPEAILEAETI